MDVGAAAQAEDEQELAGGGVGGSLITRILVPKVPVERQRLHGSFYRYTVDAPTKVSGGNLLGFGRLDERHRESRWGRA